MTDVRIVKRPSNKRLYYQGYTDHLSNEEIGVLFMAKFGKPPVEIVRSDVAGSIVLAGPVVAGNGRYRKERV